ncbi:cholinesterase-like isoform X2 [Dendronephthya gigantea]|uniref:cholinesterase-like isoform X2 n=1 Tax=Dendronephthya gigantea TaxID=151771 RepID=UPI0010696CEC|nr:cholinesterase-like isoform X2 [Dendronephthya gigantea]
MPMKMILLLFLSINLHQIKAMYTEVITTNSGKVRGLIQSSSLPGIKVQKFLNIPYAEAPVGELRFEKPKPRKPWNETLNSTEVNIACFQKYIQGWNLTEDCLILNIWTRYPQPKNATVMVYIHGGSFRSGSSRSRRHNGANFVAVGDVILVTINYRLSGLGFLTSGDDRIKGNLGLYDQRLAMKWVKENIASFGGNPETITLFGLSAGASSVSAHTISEESWPYFDRVILQSGNMLMPWAILSEAQIKKGFDSFLKAIDCRNDENLLTCLKTNITHDKLQDIYMSKPYILKDLWLAPVVDGEFIKDQPYKLFKSGHVKNSTIILGITKDEMFFNNQAIIWQTRNITKIQQKFKDILKEHFKNKPERVQEYAYKLYYPECTPSFIEAFRPIVDIYSDIVFTCGTKQEALLRSNMPTSEVYLYRYSYATPSPYSAYPRGQLGFAAHGADFLSSFGRTINNPSFPAEDQILSMRVILYWTNFAKTGNPNKGTTTLPLVLNQINNLPTWPRHTITTQEFLDMGSLSQMKIGTKLREKYCEFLKDPEEMQA